MRTVADAAADFLGAVPRPVQTDMFATRAVICYTGRQWWKRLGSAEKRRAVPTDRPNLLRESFEEMPEAAQ
ncbi:hypothetical protein [Mycobacterium sp. ITM-2016-00318]|uniref:hypothetical protein n=1 Tax=Mycobacterium sp. ITM-2016-00318 TaxID=2099693 RepID=UPI000CF8B8A5|nr:hypothetical protein [Mycobacterium sp. ITM-2016-00318]WNG94312.1 hypothetical protein C6A82_007715 [Mycobacterium sp. ITM-2016-00318]